MQFGIFDYATDRTMHPAELAVEVERRGFDSLFVPDHTHIPVSRQSPWPGGAELPEHYKRMMDPFAWLGVAAAVTQRIKLGTGICLIVERDPIVTAKEVATLDHLSHGRVLFGIGAGWNREEMENHGTDYTRRFKLMRERTEAMQAIWHHEVAEYHGEFVNFDKLWAWPKPAQRPHPPIFMGGEGLRTLKRTVAYADVWLPLDPGVEHLTPDGMTFAQQVSALQRLAAEAGRGRIPIHLFFAARKPEVLKRHRDSGIDGVIWPLPPTGRDAALARLDELATLRDRL
ncbi:MAG: LLM class F420-dependent oxidoreductase [Candidatus Lambdaproteobacteria bacterium]|nr:LLM class F420-dependent oxidoreductase [Candidatus Lambdaproteobacteria bacterium]